MTNQQWIGTLSLRTLGLISVLVLSHSVAAVAEPPMDAAERQALEQSQESLNPLLQSDSQRLSPFTEALEPVDLESKALNDTLEGLTPSYSDDIEHDETMDFFDARRHRITDVG